MDTRMNGDTRPATKGTHLCLPRSALASLGSRSRRPEPSPTQTNAPRPYSRARTFRGELSLERAKPLPSNLCVSLCTVIESPWSRPRFRGNSFVDVEAAISITPSRSGSVFARPANNRTHVFRHRASSI